MRFTSSFIISIFSFIALSLHLKINNILVSNYKYLSYLGIWLCCLCPWDSFALTLHMSLKVRLYPGYFPCYAEMTLNSHIPSRIVGVLFEQAINLVQLKLSTLPCLLWEAIQISVQMAFILSPTCTILGTARDLGFSTWSLGIPFPGSLLSSSPPSPSSSPVHLARKTTVLLSEC